MDYKEPYFVTEDDPRQTAGLYTDALEKVPADSYDRLFDAGHNAVPRAPVLCAPIFTANEAGISEVLACVRNPEKNKTHPDVVSTPTIRITAEKLVRIAAAQQKIGATAVQHLFRLEANSWRPNVPEAEAPDTQAAIDKLLKVKFGIARAALAYQYAPHSLTLGDSRVGVTDGWKDIIEKIAMLNVPVQIKNEDKGKLPSHTEHYSDIRWVDWKSWQEMQDTKCLLSVYENQAAQYCIHGVCNITSRIALDDVHNSLTKS